MRAPVTRADSKTLESAATDTVAYVRVSREEQARADKTSLVDQRTRIASLAAQLGRSVGAVFEDAGVSGGTANRLGFQSLVHYCEQHQRPASAPGLVLVLNASRWGRWPNPREAAYWEVLLEKVGWRVRYVEGDDSEDATVSTLQRAIYSTQATAYREAIRRNARQGAAGTASAGFWGTEAPIGCRREAVNVRTGRKRVLDVGERKAADERVRLTPGPDAEVAFVRRLFESYAIGTVSLRALVPLADDWWPARQWARASLHAVLKNVAYIGTVQAAGVTTAEAHPALISPELFAAVQARLAGNRRETSPTLGGYPLSGLVTCSCCGSPFSGGGGRRGPEHDPDRFRFYRDSNLERRLPCPGPIGTALKRYLEPAVIGAVGDVVAQPDVLALIGEEFDRALGDAGTGQDARKAALAARRTAAEARRDRILRLVADGLCSEAEASRVLAECRQIDSATAETERLRFEGRRTSALAHERERLVAMAADFPTLAKRLGGRALRELLKPWLHSATLDKRTRTLKLAIRKVPAVGVFGLSVSPVPDCR